MGIQVTGTFKHSEDCALEKAKNSGVSKMAVALSKILGERLFLDISSPLTPTLGGKKHWLLVVEDSRNYSLSFILKESDLGCVMLGSIEYLKNEDNIQVQCLCCNNTGESVAFKKACKWEWLGLVFEYTDPGMPQQNGHVEKNLLLTSTKYAHCSTMENSMLFYETTYELKLQPPPCLSRISF